MAPITDSRNAISCINLIRKNDPCLNFYCHLCIVNFFLENKDYSYNSNFEQISQDFKNENFDI